MAALAQPGDRIGVEAMTYPIVKGLAHRLGIELVALPMDAEGVTPDAIERAHREKPMRALYLQPVLQSPLGQSMSAERRRAVASALHRHDLVCIEDSVYGFLCDEEPLAALAPDRVILIDSLSKRLAPGLSLGFVAAPSGLVQRLGAAIRTGAWTASGLPLAMALHLIDDGTARRIETAKRADATARQHAAREALAGLDVRGDREPSTSGSRCPPIGAPNAMRLPRRATVSRYPPPAPSPSGPRRRRMGCASPSARHLSRVWTALYGHCGASSSMVTRPWWSRLSEPFEAYRPMPDSRIARLNRRGPFEAASNARERHSSGLGTIKTRPGKGKEINMRG